VVSAREAPALLDNGMQGPAVNSQAARLEAADAHIVAALVAVGVIGASIFLAMPVVVGALATSGFSDAEVGQFSSVQLFCVSLGCLASLWLGPRMNVRSLAALALGVQLAMDLASVFVSSYPLFTAIRALAGMAGGAAISTTTAALARTRTADRNFGWFLLCQIVFQMLATWQLPRVVGSFGIQGVFLTFVALEIAVLALLVRTLPAASLGTSKTAEGGNTPRVWLLCAGVLLSILFFFVTVGSFWTFVGRIGAQNVGLSPSTVGSGLSLAAFGGLAGAFLPVLLGARLGRALPITLAAAALMSGLQLMTRAESLASFVVAAALFSFGWFLIYPYQLGVLASLDRDGRAVIASAALTGAGLGIGPAIVVRMLPGKGLAASYSVAMGSMVVSALLVLLIIGASRAITQPGRAGE
jgi:predicted MFS family arabinose efflux permease